MIIPARTVFHYLNATGYNGHMRLLEYEAKLLLSDADIAIPDGYVVEAGSINFPASGQTFPLIVKSQVPVGGRGKLGGVILVKNTDKFRQAVMNVSQKKIKGFRPSSLLIENALAIKHEFYLSLTINRETATIDVIAHRDGGIEIESQTEFFTHPLDGKNFSQIGESLAEEYGLEDKSFLLAEWVEKLYGCFIKNDAILLEINPLILTKQAELIAGDCKMTLDDDAVFRHPEWDFEEMVEDNNFVALDRNGTVATIANGAGLAMATVDAVTAANMKPANFLDIGGGATVETIVKSFRDIVEFPHVSAIIINIFGGIVRCDEVARAIIEARKQFTDLPSLYIRLSGTNSAEAAELLQHEELVLYPDLAACIEGVRHG